MKQRNRKRFDPEFKARVALAAVQERESLAPTGTARTVPEAPQSRALPPVSSRRPAP
jgi:hypothetical protein